MDIKPLRDHVVVVNYLCLRAKASRFIDLILLAPHRVFV